MESEAIESEMSEDSIEKNVEDLQLKIDERFKNRSESLKCKILNLKS